MAALAALAAAGAALVVGWALPAAARARGQALYEGRTPLAGRVVGHDEDLPAIASRCTNCHEAAPRSGVYAARLERSTLALPRTRRGGPPNVYDAARLCALLREGTDPGHVIISTTMPRYAAGDAQCDDLWAFLSRR